MARLPNFTRLVQEDFPSEKAWIAKLLWPLNSFMSEVVAALNKSLTFSENLRAMVSVQRVRSTNSDFSPVEFISTIGRPVGVWVMQAVDVTSGQILKHPITIDWSYNPANSLITINNVYGITKAFFAFTTSGTSDVIPLGDSEYASVGQSYASSDSGILPDGKIVGFSYPFIVTVDQTAAASDTVYIIVYGKTYDLTLAVLGG